MARRLIAGNWKMNGLRTALDEARAVAEGVAAGPRDADCLICPPFTLIADMARTLEESRVFLGGQDCHAEASGAHTGDISADMLKDLGASHVIVGHSERRTDHGESDETVAAKTSAAFRSGLTPIVCVGETLAERERGAALQVLARQISRSLPDAAGDAAFAVAYEPVWAIGSGRTPTAAQISEAHGSIRANLTDRFGAGSADSTPILYGGSLKPGNAAEILGIEDVDGGLIGGASLKAEDFLAIYRSLA